jgi:hypothetical protein
MAAPLPPGSPSPAHAQQSGNGFAVAAFVCGLLGLLLCWFLIAGGPLALLGIIFGAIGLSKANNAGRGKGLATAGLVCGVLGLVIGIIFQVTALKAFTNYMRKAKQAEASLYLRKMVRGIKSAYLEKSQLPPSSTVSLPGADGTACTARGVAGAGKGKMPVFPPSAWALDPAWAAIDFSVDEPSRYTYHWTKQSETTGYATAVGDLDCDGTLSTYRVDISVVDGTIHDVTHEPTPD